MEDKTFESSRGEWQSELGYELYEKQKAQPPGRFEKFKTWVEKQNDLVLHALAASLACLLAAAVGIAIRVSTR